MKENNSNEKRFSRRSFLKTATLTGAGMMLSGRMASVLQAAEPQENGDMKTTVYPPILTQKRVLGTGDAALEVSALSLGCMGMNVLRGVHPDEKSMIRLIRDAYERGCNFFDTAEGYGPYLNEELLGKAVSPFRDRVVIATKFSGDYSVPPSRNDNSPRRIRAACEASLRRLKVEAIDLYYQHRIDRNVPMAEVADTVARLMQEGKVKHWGVSELNARHIREAHAVCPLTAVESEYHLMFRKPEQEVFPHLAGTRYRDGGIQPALAWVFREHADRVFGFEHERHPGIVAAVHPRSHPGQHEDCRCAYRFRQDTRHDHGAGRPRMDAAQIPVRRTPVRNDKVRPPGREPAFGRFFLERGRHPADRGSRVGLPGRRGTVRRFQPGEGRILTVGLLNKANWTYGQSGCY